MCGPPSSLCVRRKFCPSLYLQQPALASMAVLSNLHIMWRATLLITVGGIDPFPASSPVCSLGGIHFDWTPLLLHACACVRTSPLFTLLNYLPPLISKPTVISPPAPPQNHRSCYAPPGFVLRVSYPLQRVFGCHVCPLLLLLMLHLPLGGRRAVLEYLEPAELLPPREGSTHAPSLQTVRHAGKPACPTHEDKYVRNEGGWRRVEVSDAGGHGAV